MERKSFVLYCDFKAQIDLLSYEDKGRLLEAIFNHECGEPVGELPPLVQITFAGILPHLERNAEKWENMRKKRAEAGKKGMAKRWGNSEETNNKCNEVITSDNKAKQNITNITVNDNVNGNVNSNVNVNDNVNVNVKDKEKSPSGTKRKPEAFRPPSLDDVQAYCRERNNKVNAERFIDFYSSKGWMIGKNKMKDWKAAVRTWEKQDAERGASNPNEAKGGNIFYSIGHEEGLF